MCLRELMMLTLYSPAVFQPSSQQPEVLVPSPIEVALEKPDTAVAHNISLLAATCAAHTLNTILGWTGFGTVTLPDL